VRTEDFVKTLRSMTAPAAPPSVAAPRGVGLGPDASEFETVAADPAATARAIIAAGNKARGGGDTLAPKLSDAAQQIIDAGKRRRGEG
jgi:hypothetical protein